MDEATTTDEALDIVSGGEPTSEPQPETPAEPAESQAEETQPKPEGEPNVEAEAKTDDHLEWLKNKGIDPSDPDAVQKAADAWRKAEQGFHQGRQEAKTQLRDEALTAVVTDNQVMTELNQMKVRMGVTDFYSAHPEAKELDTQMAKIVQAKPYLARDLEAVYALANTDTRKSDIAAAEKRGREAAKQEIARASLAKTPTGNATSHTDVVEKDPGLEAFEAAF